MKDQELELQVAPMSNDTMEYLNVLFGVCKRFKTDYYHATPKQREFIDAVATHEYQLMKAHEKGLSRASVPPFMGMKRSERSNNIRGCVCGLCGPFYFVILIRMDVKFQG